MENELRLQVDEIVVKQGLIEFGQFGRIKQQAEMLAEKIGEVEVSEENIRESKKLLAAVNKRLKELEDKRIEIKKHMLEPYQDFEAQVKEIVNIVKSADAKVREQVKYLEEFERLEKEDTLKQIFDKRIKLYKFKNLFSFSDFVKPKHLNKTTSLKAAEDDLVAWLEKIDADINVIEAMQNADDVLSAYVDVLDLSTALSKVNAEEQRRQQIEAAQAMKKQQVIKKLFTIQLFDEKDVKLVKMYMETNDIKFTLKDGN